MNNIYKRVKEIRKAARLSQAALAKEANITQKSVSRIENGINPLLETVLKLLNALGYTLDIVHKEEGGQND